VADRWRQHKRSEKGNDGIVGYSRTGKWDTKAFSGKNVF
jgi:hypothetical protein